MRMFWSATGEEGERVFDDGVEVGGAGLGGGELGEGGELVYEERMLSTEEEMTSEQRRMTAMEGESRWCSARVWRGGRCGGDLLGVERDGGEGIFDFVGDAAGDFLPGGLLSGRVKELGGVFEDEDVAKMSRRDFGERGALSSMATVARRCRVAPVAWEGGHFDFAGGGAHAVGAAEEAVEDVEDVGREGSSSRVRPMKGCWPPGSIISDRARLARMMERCGVEGGDAVGDGLEHGFELGAAGFQFEAGVGG